MHPILFAPGGDPPWGKLYLTFHIISVINHQSSIISHQSSIINHQSSMINDQSIVSTHQSSIFSRHAVITFFLTCMQRRGNVSSTHISKNKKERARKVIPGGSKKKESPSKPLNDIKKSKDRAQKTTPGGAKKRRAPQTL